MIACSSYAWPAEMMRGSTEGSDPGETADVVRDRLVDAGLRGLPHQSKRLVDLRPIEDHRVVGLLEVGFDRRAEREVEHLVPGLVFDVGHHQPVPLGERERRPVEHPERRRHGETDGEHAADGHGRSPAATKCEALRGARPPRGGSVPQRPDRLTHLPSCREAPGRRLRERPADHGLDASRETGPEVLDGLWRVAENRMQERRSVIAPEGTMPDDHLVEHHPQRPEVGPRVDLIAANLFGRHVGRRPNRRVRRGQLLAAHEFGQPEIENLDDPLLGHQHVPGLEVPVHDPALVRGSQSLRDLSSQIEHLRRRNRTPPDPLVEAVPAIARHDDEQLARRGFTDLVNVADVDVVEGGGGLGFLDEAMSGGRVGDSVGRQELQRDGPAESQVLGLEHHTHSSAADLAKKSELARDDPAGILVAGTRHHGPRRLVLHGGWAPQ